LYTSSNIIKVIKSWMRWVGHAYKVLFGKPEGKRLLGRPRHSLDNNFGIDLREIGWENVDWMHMAEDRDQWQAHVNTE
jgi:hypothetical protein